MKRITTILIALPFLGLLVGAPAFAQGGPRWQGSGGWGSGSQYNHLYNPKTVETVGGEVVTVEQFTPIKGMGRGVHLSMKTDKETLSVHLGPSWLRRR